MLINVVVGGETKYFENGQPYNDGGEFTVMDDSLLEKKEYTVDSDTDTAYVTEYWEGSELRSRSVLVNLKPLKMEAEGGQVG